MRSDCFLIFSLGAFKLVSILFLLFAFSLPLSLSFIWQDFKVGGNDDDPAAEIENSATSKSEGAPHNKVEVRLETLKWSISST